MSFEMEDLREKREKAQKDSDPELSSTPVTERTDNSVTIWAGVAATWSVVLMSERVITDHHITRLLLQSLPLLLFPRFLAFLAYSGPRQDVLLTPLERFMATNYALLLLATALCVIIAVHFLWYSSGYYLLWHRRLPHHRS
jgi:hypothetical protein